MPMTYHRLFITEVAEMYHLYTEKTSCYVLILDTQQATPKAYLESVNDADGDLATNFSKIMVAYTGKISKRERDSVFQFIEGLFLSKMAIDLQVEEIGIVEEINTYMTTEEELTNFLFTINHIFGQSINFDFKSVNNLLQK